MFCVFGAVVWYLFCDDDDMQDGNELFNWYCVIDILLSIKLYWYSVIDIWVSIFEYLYCAGDDVLVCDSNIVLLTDCYYDIGSDIVLLSCC